MPTNNPRINVTFSEDDAEIMQLICKKKKMSMSKLIRKVVEDWLEDYEDMLLARRAEEAEKRWIEGGCKTISHEELCQELGIKSNIQEMPKKVSKNSPKISNKESSTRSKKGLSRNRKKLANH